MIFSKKKKKKKKRNWKPKRGFESEKNRTDTDISNWNIIN